MKADVEKDHLNDKPLDQVEQTKVSVGRQLLEEICVQFIFYAVFLGICFLIGNVYFAYVAFGVGALFLILPFAMLVYFIAKKYVKKQRLNYQKAQQNKK